MLYKPLDQAGFILAVPGIKIGTSQAQVIDIPGHTTGHNAYYFGVEQALFCGDTMFSMGCGRLFEGTPAMMWNSLQKLMALPDETLIYCAHEYTTSNGEFAITVEPKNTALIDRIKQVADLRSKGLPTVPSTLLMEKRTNPFLRPEASSVIQPYKPPSTAKPPTWLCISTAPAPSA